MYDFKEFGLTEVILAIICGIALGLPIGAELQDKVVSKQPIRPELTINVDNTGMADTTWTYIKP